MDRNSYVRIFIKNQEHYLDVAEDSPYCVIAS